MRCSDRILFLSACHRLNEYGHWIYTIDRSESFLYHYKIIYEAQTSTWSNPEPEVAPPGRISSELACDSRFGVCILFGGQNPAGGQFSDSWAYEYASNTWMELSDLDPTTRTNTQTTPTQSTTTSTSTNGFQPLEILAITLCEKKLQSLCTRGFSLANFL